MIHRMFGCLLCLMGSLVSLSGQQMAHPPDDFAQVAIDSFALQTTNLTSQQDADSSLSLSTNPTQGRKPPLKRFTMFGYYRLFMYSRNMSNPYPGLAPFQRIVAGTGDGYREPMLSLTLAARPNGRSSFGTEMFIFTPYAGNYQENVFTMNLGLSMYGNFRTKHGNFGVRAGGINWYSVSPFTMGTFQILDRYSIFERTPWEGVTHTEKYDNYFESGRVSRDGRWGFVAFQGFIFEGGNLPGDLSFKAFYGKTQPNGGLFNITASGAGGLGISPAATEPNIVNPGVAGNVPNYFPIAGDSRFLSSLNVGGQIKKNFGENHIAYNTMNSNTFQDTVLDVRRGFNVHTLSFDWMLGKARLTGEMGAGRFYTPDETSSWGEALMLRLNTPKEYTFLPFEFQFYQIDKNYFNINSEIQTFSNPKFTAGTFGNNQSGQAGSGAGMPLTGQLAHNRRGMNVSTTKKVGPVYIGLNYGIAQEMEALSSVISYDHRINGLALSRIYNPFPANATGPTVIGPYSRKTTYFRGTFEQVQLTDIDPATGAPLNRKYFTSAEITGKYRVKFGKRHFYAFYLGSWQSANSTLSLNTSMKENAYVSAQYHELDLYYELFPKFMLAGYIGRQRIQGGAATQWNDETALPLDQLGEAYAIGFDWTLAENAGFYVRHRRMRYADRNWELDQFQGHASTFELKIFF